MTIVTTSSKIPSSLSSKLPAIMAVLAFIACNGTIILVSVFGITLAINPSIQAATISLFAFLTVFLCSLSIKNMRKKGL